MSNDVIERFKDELKQHSGRDFVLDSPLGSDHAKFRFLGMFEGHEVLWHTHVYTLKGYRRLHPKFSERQRNFIDMAEEGGDEIRLEIGIQQAAITHPQILMTIKMIHKFKNLRRGFHEWGEVVI